MTFLLPFLCVYVLVCLPNVRQGGGVGRCMDELMEACMCSVEAAGGVDESSEDV